MKIYLKKFVLGQVTLIFALACFALSPQARAVCQQGCDTDNSNTFLGDRALIRNTTGSFNTATGFLALLSNTDGVVNTATGAFALQNNRHGGSNTATGYLALVNNLDGEGNTATGVFTLYNNSTGDHNTATGLDALMNLSSGSGNIALGESAGINRTTGSNNIDIGNTGIATESGIIRIGTPGTHTATFIAGVSGAGVMGAAVKVNAAGQIGTAPSSARFKEEIKPMDKSSEAILALKPVTFRYKHDLDTHGIPQFGLIAEDVEKVNPDLVDRGADGKLYSVRYEAVNAMLLNEFLKEHRKVQELEANDAEQQREIKALVATVKEQAAQIQKVSAQIELNRPAPQTVLNNQ